MAITEIQPHLDADGETTNLKSQIYDYVPRWRRTENKHNECLDYLAIERTQLSWFNTAISVISMGIAVSTLLTKDTTDTLRILFTIIGIIFIAFGVGIVCYAFARYWLVQRKIMEGIFVRDRFSQPFVVAFGVCVCILALVVIFMRIK